MEPSPGLSPTPMIAAPPTAERIIPEGSASVEERSLLRRHQFAYESALEYIPAGATVAEVGCGAGYGAEILLRKAGRYLGTDLDPETLARAAARYGSSRCEFIASLPDAAAEVVVSFQVIEHVADPDAFLRELWRIAKSGGTILLTTPNRRGRVDDGKRPWNRFHRREYTKEELAVLLEQHPFRAVLIKGIRGDAATEACERARLRQARHFAALDPLNLRRLLPPGLESSIAAVIRRLAGGGTEAPAPDPVYRLETDATDDALDLLAIIQCDPEHRRI